LHHRAVSEGMALLSISRSAILIDQSPDRHNPDTSE
jgi:hypothetical protein